MIFLSGCTFNATPDIDKDFELIPKELALKFLNEETDHCRFKEDRTEGVPYKELMFVTARHIEGSYHIKIMKKGSMIAVTSPFGFVCNVGWADGSNEEEQIEQWNKLASALISIGIECANCEQTDQ